MKRILVLYTLLMALAAGTANASRLPRAVVPEQYKLTIAPRIDLRTYLGHEVITVQVREAVREITLHSADLDIERVYVRDSERKQRAQVELDEESSTMTLHLRKNLVPGSAEIGISFRGPLRDDLRGFYLSRSARDTYIFTQLQPVDARRFYPCFDEPDLKAKFDLSVIVDDEHLAISNTRVISSLPGPSRGTRRIRFDVTPPMSTYMLALAVGPFDCLSGRMGEVPVRFCAQKGQHGGGRATLQGTMKLLEFYEDWFGVPYPFGKLDVVALPDMAAGGMENPGAIFLRESWTMIGEDASPEMKRWAATLLAHEISHLWVGDLVTMEWWNDIWLNEGLATWLSIKALRAWAPEIGTEEMQASRRMRTFDEDSLPGRRAVAAPLVGDESLFEIFDIVTNEKPAAVMSMIEQIAGEPAVRRAMRTYLIRHSWGNASTADFVALVESEIGQDAAAVMHDYVSRPGYPVVEVSSGCEGSSRRVLFEEVRSDGESWTVPVCYRPLSNAAMTECVVLRGRTSVTIDADCNVPLLVNPGLPGYFRVLYDRRELGRIVESTSALSIPEKLNLLDNEWWLVMEGHHSLGDYLTMLEKGFAAESDPSVVTMIVSRLSFVDRTYVSAESRAAFTEWLRSYLGPQLRRVGLRPANDETQEQASLRRELLWAAGALARDPEVLRFAQQYVRDYLSRRDPGDPSVADVMIHLAARSGDEALYNAYLARVRRARNPQEGYRFLMGLTSFTSPDLVRRTFELTLTNVVRAQDASNIIGKLLSNPESAEPAWQVARERWIEIRKRLPETFTSERIVHATGSFCSAESRDEVASFFEKNAAARKTLRMSLARIDRCVATRPANLAALGTWLSDSEPHLRAVAAGP